MRALAGMRHTEISIRANADDEQIESAIDAAIRATGLSIAMRGTLKKHPGCIHWHVKNGRQSGTLEITFWPSQHRAWFTVQNGRTATWIDEKLKALSRQISRQLRKD